MKLYFSYLLDYLFGHRWYIRLCVAHPDGFYFACRYCGETRNLMEFYDVETVAEFRSALNRARELDRV